MTSRAERILEEALALPADERATLGARLLESVDAEPPDVLEAAWRDEIASRIAEVESGNVQLESWDEVREKARAVLRRG